MWQGWHRENDFGNRHRTGNIYIDCTGILTNLRGVESNYFYKKVLKYVGKSNTVIIFAIMCREKRYRF